VLTTEQEEVAAALHAQHVAEFDFMKGDRWSDPVAAAECGNCQRWAKYAIAAHLASESRPDVETICERLHDAYEAAAVEQGWETQAKSRKPWADVPEANKATMRAAVSAAIVPLLPPTTTEPQGQQGANG
jgi:hypothetical protein